MKQPIRSFSIGLFTASLILLIVFLFVDDSKSKTDDIAADDMIEALKEDGYRVLSESEYISLSVNDSDKDKTEEEKEDKQATEQKDNEKAEKEENKVDNDSKEEKEEKEAKKTYSLTIKSGMASSEISNLLVENDIINDAGKFSQYLEEEGYAKKVQLGKFKVSSDMSNYEIAEKITK
ncbi:hypothetical protein [Lentibacillus sp. Marseille-P4043]|uniref:hypothetical protein n=1 Tax=Lentibacillus sp. Marseille-P4043 TaxID=2040293 RepID=UPI000D0BABCD|nr:hypothetical protein [Lentibacillus sp. Marseille-P4043]